MAICESDGKRTRFSEDILAVLCGSFLLLLSLGSTLAVSGVGVRDDGQFIACNPMAHFVGKPGRWQSSPVDAFRHTQVTKATNETMALKLAGTFILLGVTLGAAVAWNEDDSRMPHFLAGFAGIFLLATIAYVIAGNVVIKAYNLEYALWALAIGMIISNTIGTPPLLSPAIRTEFFIKTGLVLLGAEVLWSRLLALGLPGIGVAWVVTPVVLISTYWFGQRILKLESRSLNMVISADMSVCGVSAAIAAAAACRAKKEELTLAIGMSLSFTVVMMVVLPLVIKALGMGEVIGGAWLGGTIDSTGAVAAAGAVLGDRALEVAATVKMIQNILIGVAAFGIATYWVSFVENAGNGDGERQPPRATEIWARFPRFILGFMAVSLLFSILHAGLHHGPELTEAVTQGSTRNLRGWLFCLAFVCIGLETRFGELAAHVQRGKPVALYVCGQTLNLFLTLLMAYLMFGVVFRGAS